MRKGLHAISHPESDRIRRDNLGHRVYLGKHCFYDALTKKYFANPIRFIQSDDQFSHLADLDPADVFTCQELPISIKQSGIRWVLAGPCIFEGKLRPGCDRAGDSSKRGNRLFHRALDLVRLCNVVCHSMVNWSIIS